MKKLTVHTSRILAAALLVVACAATARAGDEEIVASVPFDFVVGHTLLPAGKYTVKRDFEDPSVLAIESSDGRQAVYALTISAASSRPVVQPELVFEKRDNKYVLARMVPADGDEREIPLTHGQRTHEVAVIPANP